MPQPVLIILIIIGALLVLGLIFSLFFTFFVAYKVYSKTLMRDKHSHWGREHCSEPGNPALETMWKRGLEWAKKDKSFIKELSIHSNDGLKLVGEWFDYGFDKTIVILPGRRETLVYSYYYAQPYKELGINVLVIDQRAHGLSEGTYSTCGIKEADDVKLWLKYMHDEHNQKDLYIHGICVGTCVTSIVLATFKEPYLKGAVLDSAFITYKEIYIWCTTVHQGSSRKIKKNIIPIEDAAKILELQAVSFDYIEEEMGTDCRGFIAEDVAEVLPNLVIPEEGKKPAGLDYITMIPYLQAVIKEQEKRITELEKKLNEITGG